MTKNDQISQIISLIFSLRQLFHEKDSKSCCKASPLHLITLGFIRKHEPLMKEIADFLAVAPPSATSLINHFIEMGLVKRKENEQDRRIIRITITPKGEKYLENNTNQVLKKIRKGMEGLNDSEQKQLIKILTKIIDIHKK